MPIGQQEESLKVEVVPGAFLVEAVLLDALRQELEV
jgi:hypothetical protein